MIDLYIENTKPHGEFYTQYINTPQHRKQVLIHIKELFIYYIWKIVIIY